MQNSKRKIRVFILITLLLVGMVIVGLLAHSKSSNSPYFFEAGTQRKEKNQQEKDILVSEYMIEKVLLENVPELYTYEEYIQKESGGQAGLCIQIYESTEVTDDSFLKEGKYYPIYVGESWENHNVNWDWFYISQDLETIYWYDIVEGVLHSLDEWRVSDKYRKLTGNELGQDIDYELYMEFLEGSRSVNGMMITDITTPTGETDKQYFTEYTFSDSDTDGLDELHIRSERYYYIIDCENDELSVWKGLHPRTELLNNGDYLYTHIGGAPLHHDYKYFRMSPEGEEVWSITYNWYDENSNGEFDEEDLYIMQDTNVLSYEEWKEVQENYLNVGTDKVWWRVLEEVTTKNNVNLSEELDIAQEERIHELATNLSKCIGKWNATQLTLPMSIGQDSTRSQMGIELCQADIEIFKDFSVQLGREIYMINDIVIRDYEWYLDRFRQGPYFAEGLIVELEYVNAEEDKKFSICIAENEMYLFSYAFGFYSVVRQDKESNVFIDEIEESVFDRLSNAYIKRYGDIESQLDSICGVWEGRKYSFADELAKLEGTYGMELKWENEAELVIDFEGKELETRLLDVFSTGSYTEEYYYELLNIPSQVRPYLRQYSEGYILHLKQDEKDIYIALSKDDLEQKECGKKMEIFIEEELYSFQ